MIESPEKESALRKILIGVAIAVLAPVVLALFQPALVASWLVGAGQWLLGLIQRAWSALSTPVPAWLVVCIVLTVVVALLVSRRTPAPASPVDPPISNEEKSLIEMLAAADGDWLTLEVLAIALGWRRLEAEHIAERLMNRRYLLYRGSSGTNRLSPAGRDFALANGLMGGPEVIQRLRNAAHGQMLGTLGRY